MSTGTALFIAFAVIACLVALGLMFAAVIHHLQSDRKYDGYISDNERSQTGRTAFAAIVGATILAAFFAFGLPLAKHLGQGLDADPAAETSTSTPTSTPVENN